MKLNNVLIVFKKYSGDHSSKCSHLKDHLAAIDSVPSILKKLGLKYTLIDKENFDNATGADLVLTIGGDGTFLAASHSAGDAPLIGLNSMPGYSVGFFCAARTDELEGVLKNIIEGKMRPKELPLVSSFVNGRKVKEDALNDILFAGHSPAEMARYTLKIGDRQESQKSSGVWISSGPGSTAAMHSAGGCVFDITSGRLEYLVREPYHPAGRNFSLINEVLSEGGEINIVSKMKDAAIFIDGPSVHYLVKEGDTFTAKLSEKSLKVYL